MVLCGECNCKANPVFLEILKVCLSLYLCGFPRKCLASVQRLIRMHRNCLTVCTFIHYCYLFNFVYLWTSYYVDAFGCSTRVYLSNMVFS